MFHWKCKLLAKRKKCFRNFSVVGRKCFNCKYLVEQKEHQYPQFLNPVEDADAFFERFEQFEEWVNALSTRRVHCEGTIQSVKPDMIFRYDQNKKHLRLRGFLVSFNEGFIDNRYFTDRFYLHLSSELQNRLLLREADEIEFDANLKIVKGRFEFIKAGRFEFMMRGKSKPIKKSDALVALNTYTVQKNQPSKCLGCKFGLLTDIQNKYTGNQRELICLKGVADYRECAVSILDSSEDNRDFCANDQYCNHAL